MIGKKTLLKFFKISPTPSLMLLPDAPKFTIVNINDAYLDATYSEYDDIVGKGFFEAFPINTSDSTVDVVKNLSQSLQTVVTTLKKHKMDIQKYDIPIRGTSKFELKYWESENIPLLNNNGKIKFIIHSFRDLTEKTKVKNTLKEFEYFFNNSNDFSCIANAEGYFEIANPSFKKVLGYSQNELEIKPFIDFVHPDDIAATLKVYDQLKSGATLIHFINRYRKKDGAYLWLDWNATPNPVTGKLYCIARDFTESKKAEMDLNNLNQELEQRVKERTEEVEKVLEENSIILESIGDAFIAVDKLWSVTYWNHIAESDFNVLKQDIVGKSLWDVFSDIDSESYKKYHKAVAMNQVVHFEYCYMALNKWYEISTYPSENGLSIFFREITERKISEKKIKDSDERFKALMENNFDIISLSDDNLNLIYQSPSATRITGWTDAEMKNENTTSKIHFEDREKAKNTIREAIKNPGESIPSLFRYLHKGGHYIWLEGKVTKLADGNVLKGIIYNWRDVTERIELEYLLVKANSLARLGSWDVDLLKGTVYWDDITREIHEAENNFVPDLDTGINFYKEGPGRDLITEKVKEAIELGTPWDEELEIITAKNNVCWIRTIGETEFADGKCIRIYGSFQDITERKKAEIDTERLNERLQLATESAQLGLWDWDVKNNSLIWDKAMYNLYNLTENEFTTVYDGWASRVHKEDRQRVDNEIQLALENKKDYNPEFRILWPDLSVHYINASGIIERDNDGNAVRMTGFNWDVTERKQAEKKLIESEKLFRDLFQNMQQGFAYCKGIIENEKVVDYFYIAVNSEYEKMFKVENIKGKKSSDVFPEAITSDASYSQVLQEVVLERKSLMFDIYYAPSEKWLSVTGYNSENENFVLLIEDITERKKSEELIKKSNERFEYVSKATFDAIWDWNIKEDKIYWGDGFEKIFGYKPSMLKNDSTAWLQNIHPKDIKKLTESYYTIVKNKQINWIEEYRYKKSNGQYAHVINKGIVIRDTSGRATRIIGAMQDITKRKQEELQLKLLESVVTNTGDSILITEAEPFHEPGPRIIYVNDAFTKMTGYKADEVVGKTPRILQGPKTDREELNKLRAEIRKWQPSEVTLLNYKKNGEEFWNHISINPVADAKGWYTHWIAIQRDITQQKREEERLKLLETVITNTNDAVLIKEAKPSCELGRKIVYANESFTRISGYTSDEIIGRTHKLLQGPKTNKEELVRYYKALDEWQPYEIEMINYNKNGKEYWVNLSLNPVTNSKGEYTHWISIERDVTERKHNESKLKKLNRSLENHIRELAISNQELEQFAYVASHDLQEPLRMITSFLAQIEKKYEDVLDEKGKKYIFFAVDGAKRMRQIILDLLEFSRVGKNEKRHEKADLNIIIEEIFLLYRKQIEEKKAVINYEPLPTLQSSVTTLRQVFQNLISNSLKYSSPDIAPVIDISCSESNSSWKFEIKDNGIGINPEYYDKIFVIFQRLHTKEEYSGTGMGLAITKKSIENLKGKIWVTSEEGKGSCFYFTIPKK
ncbi:PAS domain [Flavobacteriaceae bacterium]